MISESITLDHTIEFFNSLIQLDHVALRFLVECRVPCNEALAVHPTVQVVGAEEQAYVGVLGVLNGLFGVDDDGWGGITAVFEDDGTLTRFERTQRGKYKVIE